MDAQANARRILERARDLLIEQLSERVVESRDEIFDDALGLSYLGEIGSIHEQLGQRLQQVNSMLASLPRSESASRPCRAEQPESAELGAESQQPFASPRAMMAIPLPGPNPVAGILAPATGRTFKMFLFQIQTKQFELAGFTLAELLGLDWQRAKTCTEWFAESLELEPGVLGKLLQLHTSLSETSTRKTLLLLREVFGLRPAESVVLIEGMRSRIAIRQTS